MRIEDQRRISAIGFFGLPLFFWFVVASEVEGLHGNKLAAIYNMVLTTHTRPYLIAALVFGLILGFLFVRFIQKMGKKAFGGADYMEHLRGTEIVPVGDLIAKTTEKKMQLDIGGVPMPTKIENLHMLVQGSTGTGKTVVFRRAIFSSLKRKNRCIILDSNGDMLSRFYQKGDKILNPYDARSEGWNFFNEVSHDFDFERLALSIVPRGENTEAEEWASYARLLFSETARKLFLLGRPNVGTLYRYTCVAQPDEVKEFLSGTAAESLFVGADRALASARFVLSAKLPAHLKMPNGDFSLRAWLDDPEAGNLFIPWREDQRTALKPLVSAWVDALCSSILSLEEDPARRIVMSLDELDSLEKLASLEAALTKGRKNGLVVIAGIQSTAQLDKTYGRDEATVLRSNFRSLLVLGGSRTDPRTGDDMSRSLGMHEVRRERPAESEGRVTYTQETKEERVVTAAEIVSLPELTGYLAFAGMNEIAKISFPVLHFKKCAEPYIERVA